MELNQPKWALRYGFFQMPRDKNGFTGDDQFLMSPHRHWSEPDGPFLRSWAMVTEFERRYSVNAHPGAIRFLAWLNEADMASYTAATAILQAEGPGADISAARAYRYKYGFGLNWEQEIAKNVGMFSRLGWNDGHEQAWTFTDVNWTASLGLSVKGEAGSGPDDTFGLAGIVSGASRDEPEIPGGRRHGHARRRRRVELRPRESPGNLLRFPNLENCPRGAWITSSSPTRRSTVIAGRCPFSAQDSTGNFNE